MIDSFSGVDIEKYMKKVGLSDLLVEKVTKSGLGDVAIAFALYKIATPARYTVTLGKRRKITQSAMNCKSCFTL